MERDPNQGPTGGLTPHIQIGDKRAAEAIDWYVRAFGATEMRRQSYSRARPSSVSRRQPIISACFISKACSFPSI